MLPMMKLLGFCLIKIPLAFSDTNEHLLFMQIESYDAVERDSCRSDQRCGGLAEFVKQVEPSAAVEDEAGAGLNDSDDIDFACGEFLFQSSEFCR